MIRWLDFVLDDFMGPVLDVPALAGVGVDPIRFRRTRLGSPGVMDDAARIQIQETGQEQRPARMVGLSDTDSSSQTGMEAGRENPTDDLRQRGARLDAGQMEE